MARREIKFRFYDKRIGIMTKPFGIGVIYENINEYVRNCRDGNYVANWLDIISMQFTGLKDLKEKYIYEGDILKVGENLICEIVFVETNVEDYGDEIHSAFHAKIYKHNKIIPLDSYLKNNCIVIGNIYQNPELLSANKDKLSEPKV